MHINLAGAFFKPASLTREQCQRHYEDNHGPLIRDTTDFSRDVTRYTQHKRLFEMRLDEADSDICGVSQLLYRDLASIRDCFAGGGYSDVIRPDEHRFADLDRALVVIGPVETPIPGGEDAPFRLFRFIRAGRGERRRAYGEAIARELSSQLAGLSQTFSLDGENNPFSAAALFDGVDELRFTSLDQAVAFLREEAALADTPPAVARVTVAGGFRQFI